ncbi:hypothetical protein B7486_48615 [cyanobacterium TDX16]|nr:hypothetical protein B7486_48615 [cyanobacterium TDX16]
MTIICSKWSETIGLGSCLAIGVALACTVDSASAQITPDNTMGGENSTVTSTDEVDAINGGATRGANLFHSFQEFNVNEGRAAVFTNPNGIENILTRVTGANPSNILGTLGVAGNANLFLLNPNGIIFGANARLNVGGSFVATTANAVGFDDRGVFSATNPNTPGLLTVNPSAFFFNQIATAPIQNNSVAPAGTDPAGIDAFGLQVPDGKSLLLIGGNVSMDGGKLNAYGGRVELGGLGEPGTVELDVNGDRLSTRFPENAARADVALTDQAGIYVEGSGGGDIAVNARNLEILERSVLSAGIGQGLGTPETVAGDITLNATEEIKVADTRSRVDNSVRLGSKGNAGNITINAGSFSLQNGTRLAAVTFGQGNAGNVTVSVLDAVSLADANIFTIVAEGGVGKGGNIDINAATLSLTDGAQLQSVNLGQGNAGNVRILASGNISIDGAGADTFGSAVFTSVGPTGIGDGGDIYIQSSSLSLTNGGELVAGVFRGGQGNSGNVTVNVKNSIHISGVNTKDGSSSGLFTDPEENSQGQGGEIFLNADALKISNGGILSARTRNAFRGGNIIVNVNSLELTSGGQILAAAFDKGNAGDIKINATKGITISGSDPTFDARLAQFGRPFVDPINSLSGVFANTDANSTGQGGSIKITTGQLQVQNQAQVTVSSAGIGVAGELNIAANSVRLNNGSITAQTRSGNGGDLTLNVKDLLLLRNNSQISTTAGTAQQLGDGGNITINTSSGFIVAAPRENSDITANAFTGRGGRVEINAQSIFGIQPRSQLTPENDITASSELGISGTLEINTPNIEPNSGLVNLPSVPVDTQLAQNCTPSSDRNQSEFIVTGRGGLPPNPTEVLSSDATSVDWVALQPTIENQSSPTPATNSTVPSPVPMIEATGWVSGHNGEVILTASNVPVPPHNSWQSSAGCNLD